ncbi:peptidase S8 [Kibdelosporangium aridum]|uniref:Peptidase S8 n=1 Tax=Kibdelosporangium aridum TaxID=2030 RepID=A0A428Y322_KIBAR|nr:S8 family serine peptidase [Kibdelosporangium aridum]RSM61944.1 peptidase S8 [Kibdelosporangium aridum]
MSHKRSAIAVLAGLVACGLAVPISGNAAPVTGTAPPDPAVTLFTGDKVVLGGEHGVTVLAGKGREGTRFSYYSDERGDVHVIPEDARPLLRANKLDQRLFNVTQLIKNGYDDKTRADIPLIVSGGVGLAKERDLPSLNASVVRVDKAAGLRTFAVADKIWLDGPVRASLDKSIPQIGAPEAWNSGHTGKGTTVAVLDTGIDAAHADLSDAVVGAQDFTGSASGTDDRDGHGTHVASIITGEHAKYRGVAPDAKLLNGKVLNDFGSGQESWIIAGMEWASAKQDADVINMSLGSSLPSDGTDPMSQAVNRLTAETGSLFVIAAGNTGGMPPSPGAADAALTVGAVDHSDALADFSSRGPRWADNAIKPDITAPGVDIAAAKATHGRIGTPVDPTHVRLSGTSMAAPHVAGAAAILAGLQPSWQANEIKSALMGSAKPNPSLTVFEQGAGRLDVAKAVRQPLRTSPASVNAGVALWPHNDDEPIRKALKYHNSGSAPVAVDISASIRDPRGNPAPAGMFTFSSSTVTVPAGGEAEVVVTIDTRVNGPDGLYSGVVEAGGVRTPIAVNREVESYDVTVNFIDHNGNLTPRSEIRFVEMDIRKAFIPDNPTGSLVARLPKGRYFVDSGIDEPGPRITLRMEPEFVVSGNTTLDIDARRGKPIGFTVDKPNAKAGTAFFEFTRKTSWPGGTGAGFLWPNFDGVYVVPSQTSAAPGQFTYTTQTRMAEPDGNGGFTTSPYMYHLNHAVDGRVPDSLIVRVRDNQLARVRSEHGTTAEGSLGTRDNIVTRPLPYTLDELYTPDFPWYNKFSQQGSDGSPQSSTSTDIRRSYKLGPVVTERWNFGVFGPAFVPEPNTVNTSAARAGDVMLFNFGLYADHDPRRTGSSNDTGSTTLYRNGVQIGTEPWSGYGLHTVPTGDAEFRLHIEARNQLEVSNKVVVDWTFRSGTTPSQEALPLIAVRFAPHVDARQRVSRLVPTVIPVHMDHNSGGQVRSLTVQVSHDEGVTWKAAPVANFNGKWFTVVSHPSAANSVSLRASAKDAEGNSVDQTIHRAFLLK